MKYLRSSIFVEDLARSLRFYCDCLGFSVIKREEYPDEELTLVFLRASADADGGPSLELIAPDNGEWERYMSHHRSQLIYHVDSIAEIESRLTSHGYALSLGPLKTADGLSAKAFIDDPDGYEIVVIE
jgi:lactoylglutathione lyase